MACTHPYWSVLQVGSQHLARQFAKNGWDVHYISAPVTPLHLAGLLIQKAELAERFKCALNLTPIQERGNLFSHIPFSLIAPAEHSIGCRRYRRAVTSGPKEMAETRTEFKRSAV